MKRAFALILCVLIVPTAPACTGELTELGAGQLSPVELTLSIPAERTFEVKSEGYVTIDFRYPPFEKLFLEINVRRAAEGKLPLKNRGEAHLTVITPPEMSELKKALSAEDLSHLPVLALELGVATAPIQIKGVGVSQRQIKQKKETVDAEAVYVMVGSEAVTAFRAKVAEIARKKNPDVKFDPAAYAPHITLGFTHRDLHVSDGVDKTNPDTVIPLSGG